MSIVTIDEIHWGVIANKEEGVKKNNFPTI
jgi:hypothetical protein